MWVNFRIIPIFFFFSPNPSAPVMLKYITHAKSFRIPAGNKEQKKEEGANLCLRHNLCLFWSISQAMFIFTLSHLAISQIDDVSNWKAWNILEESMKRGQPCFYFPWLSPRWKKNGNKKGLELVLDEEQRSFFWYDLGSFGRFMAFNLPQSILQGQGVKSEDRYMCVSTPAHASTIAVF